MSARRDSDTSLTQDLLRELLDYDPETGVFVWRSTGKGIPYTLSAGTLNNRNQVQITINYKRYLASRLAWLYIYGEPVPYELDHINGNCSDNRLANIRPASHAQNAANRKTRRDNTSGQKGVCWDKQKNKWKVQIGPAGNRTQKHFVSYDDAVKFAKEESVRKFGEFAKVV